MATQDSCRFEGCTIQPKIRGMCERHYQLAMKGSPDNPEAAIASEAMLPAQPKSGRKWKMPAGGTGAAAARENMRGDAPSTAQADAVYAAICAFATGMGIRHMDYGRGRLFFCREEKRAILLTAEADMRDVEIKDKGALVIRGDVRMGKENNRARGEKGRQ